jgi:hypothetical protein
MACTLHKGLNINWTLPAVETKSVGLQKAPN